ncbi:MAG: transporter substrate-binding domain-containing protein [Clostridia bacterium]|nr:transporter substrate-binding domain-containing protein [Clostridia bacterium]
MRTSKKALSLFIALMLAVMAAFGLMAACSGGERDATESSEGAGYVSGTPLGIIFERESVTLAEGDRASLYYDVPTDGNRYTGGIAWVSSDESVATVESGIVTAKKEGETTVTATVNGTNYSASCLVTVTAAKGDDYVAKVLNVGVKSDVKNFGYYDYVTRTYSGMEIDLAYMIADELGYDEVKFVTVDPSEREDDLQSGAVDMVIATYSITEERRELVNFSAPYYTDSVQVLLGREYSSISSLKSVSDFPTYLETSKKTVTVGTVEDTTAFSAFNDYCAEELITWESPLLRDYFVNETFADYEACWEALEAGETDAFIADHSILQSYAGGSSRYRFLSDEFSEQQYGVATALESDIADDVNAVVDMFLADGTIDALLASYGLA